MVQFIMKTTPMLAKLLLFMCFFQAMEINTKKKLSEWLVSPQSNDEELPMEALPTEVIMLLFNDYLDLVSKIYFYKTCKRLYTILKDKFSVLQVFTYLHDRPVMKIYRLFSMWVDPKTDPQIKDIIKNLLLTQSQIQVYSKYLFDGHQNHFDYKPKGLPKISKWSVNLFNSKIGYLLLHSVDPEVVAILVRLYPHEMFERFSYIEDSLWLIKYFGHERRAKPLLRLVFAHRRIPILEVFAMQYNRNPPYFPNFSDHQMDIVLSFSVLTTPMSSIGLQDAFYIHMKTQSNFENFLKLFPDHYTVLSTGRLVKLLSYKIPLASIKRICYEFKPSCYFKTPKKYVKTILIGCIEDETFVINILNGLEPRSMMPFWNSELDDLVKRLGYSDTFRATISSTMRYKK